MTFEQPGPPAGGSTMTTIHVLASTTTDQAVVRPLWQRVYLGKASDPRWARPGLLGVLALAAVLYCWNLSGNGYANTFYAAAVKSGTQSWSSMFFGSLDTGNFITVDKPPFALWVMEISCRIFGFSSPAMLLPIALCGVAAVGVLYSAVRRSFGPAAGLIAAAVCAVTPITVAINRDNNPDPVLVLLMTLGAWFILESMRTKKLRHLLWAAMMIGCAFNTKTLAGYMVLPALTLVYLYAAEGGFWKRIRHLALFTAVLAVASFWWMLIVDAIPAADRPYVGGSTNDSEWGLATGYNGLGRLTGGDGTGSGGGFSGSSGLGRMFNDVLGTQISWLLPAAGLLFVAALVLRGRARRTDPERAALLLWGLWLGVHFAVFSYQNGVIHPYYSTAMAPAIGALVGGGGVVVWRAARTSGWAWLVLPVTAAVTAYWSVDLLTTNSYATWLDPLIIGAAVIGIGALVLLKVRPEQRARLGAIGLAALLVVGLAGPAAFAAAAASSTTSGVNPLAGPSNGSLGGGPGGGGAGGRSGPGGAGGFGGPPGQSGQAGGLPGGSTSQFGGGPGETGGGPGGAGGFSGPSGSSGQTPPTGGELRGDSGTGFGGAGGGPGGAGGMGGDLSSAEISYLEQNQGSAKWLIAVSGSSAAADLIVQTGRPVISMFGFTGSDPAMTVARLEQLVAAGELKYVELGGGMGAGPGGGAGTGSDVDTWVQKNCAAVSASEYGGTSGSTSTSASATASSASGLYACTAKAG
ncbi:MAG TPA: glycosyltransferase family 39 protein [Actinocrinis sp.]|nr:glycosyltransferase family 39 protein [Actinocrinis sp.]